MAEVPPSNVEVHEDKETLEETTVKSEQSDKTQDTPSKEKVGVSDSEEYETLEEESDGEGEGGGEREGGGEVEAEAEVGEGEGEASDGGEEEEEEGSEGGSGVHEGSDTAEEEEGGGGEEGDDGNESATSATRQQGDGQESLKEKKLDHDEDRRDPQYIPKKGIFYEHDDRTNDPEEEEEEEGGDKKKQETGRVWKEPGEKWGHDMYCEDDQVPKSAQELIDIYGYDIRQEEAPPKARRRRRYGRGPTKYTRSWEDETAYNKKKALGRGRGFTKRAEDFPPLLPQQIREEEVQEIKETPSKPIIKKEEVTSPSPVKRGGPEETVGGNRRREEPVPRQGKPFDLRQRLDAVREGGSAKKEPPPGVRRSMEGGGPRAAAQKSEGMSPRQGGGRGMDRRSIDGVGGGRKMMDGGGGRGHHTPDSHQTRRPPEHGRGRGRTSNPPIPVTPPFRPKGETDEEDIAALSKHFSDAVINVVRSPKPSTPMRGSSAPPSDKPAQVAVNSSSGGGGVERGGGGGGHERGGGGNQEGGGGGGGGGGGRSKRYSTQRQRSLPQTSHGPSGQANTPPAYLQQPPPPQQQYYQQHAVPGEKDKSKKKRGYTGGGGPAGVYPPEAVEQLGLWAGGAGGYPPAPAPPGPAGGYPPAPAPPQYPPPPQFQAPPPPPPIINFVAQPPHQPYPIAIPPPPVPTVPEVYTGQGGITYYSTQGQVSRPNTSRRVKLAIPIVPPPEQQQQESAT